MTESSQAESEVDQAVYFLGAVSQWVAPNVTVHTSCDDVSEAT